MCMLTHPPARAELDLTGVRQRARGVRAVYGFTDTVRVWFTCAMRRVVVVVVDWWSGPPTCSLAQIIVSNTHIGG